MSAPKDGGAQQQVFIKILEDLLKLPENRECADCGTKAPRWSSTNLGVFVCIRCSGIHRSLGTHISKVKSVSLDKWTQEQIDVMKSMGNARAKEVFEAYVPEGYSRVTPASENFALEQWIRDKYERKKFMKRDGADHVHAPRKDKREHRDERDNNRDHPREAAKPAGHQSATQPSRVNQTKPPAVVTPAPAPVAAPPAHDLLNFDEPQPAPASPPNDVFGDFTSATSGQPAKDKNSIMSLYNTPLAPAGHPGPYPGMPYGGPPMMAPMPYPGPNYNLNMGGPPMPPGGVPPNYYMAGGRGMGVPPGPNYNVHLTNPVAYGGNPPPNYYQPGPAYGGGYTHAPPPGLSYAPNPQLATGNNMINGLTNLNLR